MKRIILFIIGSIQIMLLNAQEYRPMLTDGRVWKSYWTNGHYEGFQEESICGDSIIDGEKWFKLYYSLREWNTDTIVSKRDLRGFLREQDKQVFYLNRYGIKQQLYDFNLKTGDIWYQSTDRGTTESIIVTNIDSISSEGITYRRILVRAIESNSVSSLFYDGYWIEGIGCSRGLLITTGWFVPGIMTSLLSCCDGETCIFKTDSMDINELTTIGKVQAVPATSSAIYDLHGRRLSSQPQHGIYIKNKKKYVK